MSAKIYDGFVIRTPMAKLLPVLKDYKAKLQPAAKQMLLDRMHELVLEAALGLKSGADPEQVSRSFLPSNVRPDQYASWIKPMTTEPLWWSHLILQRISRAQEAPGVPVTDQDSDADVRLWLWLMPRGNATYGIPGGNRDLVSKFLEMPGVEDYGYWNNTDRPEGVTATQWRTRDRIWEELLPDYYVADNAFRFDFFDSMRFHFPIPTEQTMTDWLLKNRKKLVRSQTYKILLNYYGKENPPSGDENATERFFFLDRLAKQAMKQETDKASEATCEAEHCIPSGWDELAAMFPDLKKED